MGGRNNIRVSLTVKVPAADGRKCLTLDVLQPPSDGRLELKIRRGDTSIAPAGARKGAQTGDMYVPVRKDTFLSGYGILQIVKDMFIYPPYSDKY